MHNYWAEATLLAGCWTPVRHMRPCQWGLLLCASCAGRLIAAGHHFAQHYPCQHSYHDTLCVLQSYADHHTRGLAARVWCPVLHTITQLLYSPSAPSLVDSSESLLPGTAAAGVATTVAIVSDFCRTDKRDQANSSSSSQQGSAQASGLDGPRALATKATYVEHICEALGTHMRSTCLQLRAAVVQR